MKEKTESKKISTYIFRYWYLYLISFIAMIISIFLDMKAPRVTQRIIDDVIRGGELRLLTNLLLMLVGIGVGRAIFAYIKEFITDLASINVARDIRNMIFKHVQSLSISFFDENNTGELMARIKDDVDKIWNVTGFVGMLIVESIIHTCMVLYCMFNISGVLTIIPLIMMPLVGFTALKLENTLGKIYGDLSEQNATMTTIAQENLAGVRTVKSFAREEYEMEKFTTNNRKYYKLNMKLAKSLAKYQPNISFLTKLMLVGVLILGGTMVINDRITIGQLAAFTEYANNIIWPMECIGWLTNDTASAIASHKKLKKILQTNPDIQEGKAVDLHSIINGSISEKSTVCNESNSKKRKALRKSKSDFVISDNATDNSVICKGDIKFENVCFSMNNNQILENINFHIAPGKTLGIMGMTGAGKTSIVNVLERFYDINSGKILLDDRDIRDLSFKSLRKNISVVMQDVFLFSDTINENIKIGEKEYIEDNSVIEASEIADAHHFIQNLSERYETVVGERGVGLSGGQKQRISIARALAKKTPILVLDDSTSALDMETEFYIQKQLNKLTDTTKIIIAHRISSVRHADEIIVLDKGRIVERGNHETLIKKKGLYYKTYEVQSGYMDGE